MSRRAPLPLLFGVLQITACLDPVSSSLPPVPDSPPCVPTEAVSGETEPEPGGPLFHQIVIGQSADGLALTGAAEVLSGASVPDGVRLASGTVLVYFVNGIDGAVWVARYNSGSLESIAPITVNGIRAPAGVTDPDVQLLPNGDIRLAYLGGASPASEDNPRAICIADSEDGRHFTVRSIALLLASDTPQVASPSLVRLDLSNWLLAYSQGTQTVLARSTDGYHFTRDTTLAIGRMPELAITNAGTLRLYVCTQAGIASHQSATFGETWQFERNVVQSPFSGKTVVCDPSLIAGAGLFAFRTAG